MKKLKNNDLYPISVVSINVKANKNINKQKRNIEANNSVLKQVRAEQIEKSMNKKDNWFRRMKDTMQKHKAIKERHIGIYRKLLSFEKSKF